MLDTPAQDTTTQQERVHIERATLLTVDHEANETVITKAIIDCDSPDVMGALQQLNFTFCPPECSKIKLIGPLSELSYTGQMFGSKWSDIYFQLKSRQKIPKAD